MSGFDASMNTANPTARGFGTWNTGGQQSAMRGVPAGAFPNQISPQTQQQLAATASSPLPGSGGPIPNPAAAAPPGLVTPGAPTPPPSTNPAIPAGPGSQPAGAFAAGAPASQPTTANPLLTQLQNPGGPDQQDPMAGAPMPGQGPGAAAQPGGGFSNTRGAFAGGGRAGPSGFGGASSGFGRAAGSTAAGRR